MAKALDPSEFTATLLRIALNELFPESTYSAVLVIDQYDLLQANHALDEGALDEAPPVLEAYVIN